LYLVVPPSDISRTKPLIRLILNQIGRRLTESLDGSDGIARRHRLLMMLDEFPALGRLDFFESALAFMAGYGLRAFLIAQSLNQIDKAYGSNHSSLDNCTCALPLRPTTSAPRRRLMKLSPAHTDILLALNNSFIYVGVAGGASVGAAILRYGLGLDRIPQPRASCWC
jgi:type IV secretion system protein VirD4